MTNKCSCGARDKSKCSKENGLGDGKMCLKDYEPIPESLIERINVIKEKAKMNQTIEQRMQSIENELKELRKELEESLARYKQNQFPFTNGDISKFRSGQIGDKNEATY